MQGERPPPRAQHLRPEPHAQHQRPQRSPHHQQQRLQDIIHEIPHELPRHIVDARHHQRPHHQHDARYARHPEARNHEHLQQQQQHPHDKRHNLPIPRQPLDIKRREIEQARPHRRRQREPDAGRLQLKIDSPHDNHHQQPAQHGINQESHHRVHRRRLVGADGIPLHSLRMQHLLHALRHPVAKAVAHRLMGSKGHHLPAVRHPLDAYPLVHHRLRYPRIALPAHRHPSVLPHRVAPLRLRRRPYHGTHVRLVLVRHRLARRIDHRRRPDVRPLPHINPVARQRNQRPRRRRIIIHPHPHGHRRVEHQRPQRIRIDHHAPVRIHVQQHRIRPLPPRLLERPLHHPPHRRPHLVPHLHPIHQPLRPQRPRRQKQQQAHQIPFLTCFHIFHFYSTSIRHRQGTAQSNRADFLVTK